MIMFGWLLENLLILGILLAGIFAFIYLFRLGWMIYNKVKFLAILTDFIFQLILYAVGFAVYIYTFGFASSSWGVFIAMFAIFTAVFIAQFMYKKISVAVLTVLVLNVLALLLALMGDLPYLDFSTAERIVGWILWVAIVAVSLFLVIMWFGGEAEIDDIEDARIWLIALILIPIIAIGSVGTFFIDRTSFQSKVYFENEHIRHFRERGREFIEFGQFQDEAIRWIILRAEDGHKLLISEQKLDFSRYANLYTWYGDLFDNGFGVHNNGLLSPYDSNFYTEIAQTSQANSPVFHLMWQHFRHSPTNAQIEETPYGGLLRGRDMRPVRTATRTLFAQTVVDEFVWRVPINTFPFREDRQIHPYSYWVGRDTGDRRTASTSGLETTFSPGVGTSRDFLYIMYHGVRPSIIIDTSVLFV